ncbi:MAG: alpha-amylase family glycosyl hydrolase [Verrucomicrobiota bacterium]|nr:alpha-amylase family glycosyl hydrolase [Verrucomicrobiota bacterium]
MKLGRGAIAAYLAFLMFATARATPAPERMRIYQLFVRLFSNTNETRQPNGTLAQNGVGKFNEINDAALSSLREMGFTYIWLTGVLQQATGTDYSSIGQPADDPDLLKGIAGSPYAIKDYFDVCPDYAERPEHRIDEFKALLERVHQHQMKALLDFVPNHVARSYHSDVRPDLDFGNDDDKSKFFDPQNNFFYLKPGHGGPPLRLPGGTTAVSSALDSRRDSARPSMRDGIYEPEREHGRVTGNNAVTWTPSPNDWYETVKLNYGFDFAAADKSVREYPTASAPDKPIPNTWKKMDQVLAYWQSLGANGFRCDMAHMEPPEFWRWAIGRARERDANVVFIAEAYDNDPAKVPVTASSETNCMINLVQAGFTAVYDDPSYKALKKIYDGPGWASDIDAHRPNELVFENSLRYAENHDEVRLAAPREWGGHGMKAGPAICAVLFGLSRGPVMLYNGQEVGEPAAGIEGFGKDDARTSIFDYWSMPELVKWNNDHAYDGGKLSEPQKELRARYARLLHAIDQPAFRAGQSFPLNAANNRNPKYGRLGGESASGHWLYSFLRYDPASGQRFLAVTNLNPTETLQDVSVLLPPAAIEFLDLKSADPKTPLVLADRLTSGDPATATAPISEASSTGIWLGDIPPATARYYELAPP